MTTTSTEVSDRPFNIEEVEREDNEPQVRSRQRQPHKVSLRSAAIATLATSVASTLGFGFLFKDNGRDEGRKEGEAAVAAANHRTTVALHLGRKGLAEHIVDNGLKTQADGHLIATISEEPKDRHADRTDVFVDGRDEFDLTIDDASGHVIAHLHAANAEQADQLVANIAHLQDK